MTGKYRTIVADQPWEYDSWPGVMSEFSPWLDGPRDNRRKQIDYPTLTVAEICALSVDDLAADDARLFLWTTNRYLRDAFTVCEAWGFSYSQTLVWCKEPMGLGPGGIFSQTTEYVITARRGSPGRRCRWASTWFAFPRSGRGGHSRKPEAFQDMVESVCEGPYLELFARRQRLGWDTWGNEALEHVSLGEVGAPG